MAARPHRPVARDARFAMRAHKLRGTHRSYAGGFAGAGAAVANVGAARTVSSLGGTGIAAGLTAVGARIRGGVATRAALAVAAPAALAAVAGYGIYCLVRAIKKKASSNAEAPPSPQVKLGD